MKPAKIPTLSVNNYGVKMSIGSHEWENFRYKTIENFHINTIEEYVRLTQVKELPLPPHRKEVFDFIFLTCGKVVRSKGLDNYEFSTNTFFFLPAYQVTTMKSMTVDAGGYYCHFNSDIFYKKLFQNELLQQFSFLHFTGNPIVEVDKNAAAFVMHLLRRLEQEYKADEKCNTDFAASMLLTLFFELKTFSQPVKAITDNSAYRIANEYKSLLVKHIHEKQKVRFYADMLALSPEHLNRSVKSAFGKTAHHYLDEMLLLESKVLLKQSTLNISEIAYKVGKENPGDFIRFFKSKTGITPKQYRVNV